MHLISSQMTLPWDWDCGCDPESGSGEGPINLPGQYSVMSRDLFIIPGHKSQSQHYNWVWAHYDHLCWSLWAVLWNMSPTPALSMKGDKMLNEHLKTPNTKMCSCKLKQFVVLSSADCWKFPKFEPPPGVVRTLYLLWGYTLLEKRSNAGINISQILL